MLGFGVWSRMNQFRSIMGRAQPMILRIVSMVACLVVRYNLQRDGFDDGEEQMRPGGKNGWDHVVRVFWLSN